MAREKESYRENLARIDKAFPEKELLKFPEVVAFLGLDRRMVEKLLRGRLKSICRNVRVISKEDLARAISS